MLLFLEPRGLTRVPATKLTMAQRVRRFILESLLRRRFPYVRLVRQETGASYRDILLIRDEVLRSQQLQDAELAYEVGYRQGLADEKSRQRISRYSELQQQLQRRVARQETDDETYYRGILHIPPEAELRPGLVREHFNEAARLFHPDTNPSASEVRLINLLQEARDYLLSRCAEPPPPSR